MKRWLGCVVAVVTLVLSGSGTAAAQKSPRAGQVIVPPTNVLAPQDVGKRMHTNFLILCRLLMAARNHLRNPQYGLAVKLRVRWLASTRRVPLLHRAAQSTAATTITPWAAHA